MPDAARLAQALQGLRPGAHWTFHGDGYDENGRVAMEEIEWLDDPATKPTREEVEAWEPPAPLILPKDMDGLIFVLTAMHREIEALKTKREPSSVLSDPTEAAIHAQLPAPATDAIADYPPPVSDAPADLAASGSGGDSSAGAVGVGIMLSVDQRRAELADQVTAEYANRIAPIAEKRSEANTRIVYLRNLPERSDEQIDELNALDDKVRGYDDLGRALTDHLIAMQSALLRKSADDLSSFEPAYGWPA